MKISNNLPIKYYLNLHLLNDIPSDESIIFEIIRFLVNQISKKEDPDYSDIKFTSKTLKYVFGDRIENDDFKKNIIRVLKENIDIGNIKISNKNMYIENTLLNKFYN